TSIKLPDGSVINVPAMTVTVGPGGATVTYPDGTTKNFAAGSVIKMAAAVKGGGGGGCDAGFGIYGALALAALWVARKKQ
ncbi:MAG: SYNERG-CTERM sorting domain-containing protein, partial [Synergistaceae bacterium]|nr:SYNERG-CTERM sorting domain-containing protein [Synergistaceae bacterium]